MTVRKRIPKYGKYLISHDFSFIDILKTRILEFKEAGLSCMTTVSGRAIGFQTIPIRN